MRTTFSLALMLLILLLGAPKASAQDGEGPYLFDLMKQPDYRKAWSEMVEGETVPSWIGTFGTTLNATGAPVSEVSIAGQPYTLAWICEPHNCGDAQAYVLFAPQARQAWALLLSEGTKQHWLGKPDDAVKAAILSGVQ